MEAAGNAVSCSEISDKIWYIIFFVFMKSSPLIVGIVLISSVILGVSYYCGAQTGRWGAFSGLPESQELLKKLPMQIGDWVAEKDFEMDKASVTELQIENGYINRAYKNTKTQATVYLTIIVGPTGRVTVHTPEICFGGRDYVKSNERLSVTFPAVPQENGTKMMDDAFWQVAFVNNAIGGLESGKIVFYYGISIGKEWIAAKNPRYELRRFRYAYKLQAQARMDSEVDNVKEFLQDCSSVIHQYLRAAE